MSVLADVQSMEVDNQENVDAPETPVRASGSSDLLNSNGASENTSPKSSMYQDKCVGGEEVTFEFELIRQLKL